MKTVILTVTFCVSLLVSVAQINITTERTVNLVKQKSSAASTVKALKKGEQISLIDYQQNFYTVVHGLDTLYAYYPYIPENPEVSKFKLSRAEWHSEQEQVKQRLAKEEKAKREYDAIVAKVKEYTERFGEKYAYKISRKEIEIGMTDEMVKVSIGAPDKINATRSSSSTHEQWIYKDKYLYFDNGVLTTIQDEK